MLVLGVWRGIIMLSADIQGLSDVMEVVLGYSEPWIALVFGHAAIAVLLTVWKLLRAPFSKWEGLQ